MILSLNNNNLSKGLECSSTSKYRIKRKEWSRYMVGAKDYVCRNCKNRHTVVKFLFFLNFLYNF
jgi:hypothetical protein